MNLYNEDISGFKQAIEPLAKEYKIIRSATPGYNDRGRVNDVRKVDTVCGYIQPGGKRINTQNDGLGRRVTADYTIHCVQPNYVSMGDLIFTPYYGTLKVVSINDMREFGVMSASLVRTSTTESSVTKSNVVYDNED